MELVVNTGLFTRLGALAIMGTITVAIYHAIVTAGFNIYLLDPSCAILRGAFVFSVMVEETSLLILLKWFELNFLNHTYF